MLVSYTEMRTVKPFSYLRMVFLTIFVLFAKLKAQFLDSLTKTFKKMQTCAYKSLTGFVLERFFKVCIAPYK